MSFSVITFNLFSRKRTLADWSFDKLAAVVSSMAMQKIDPNNKMATMENFIIALWLIEGSKIIWSKWQSPSGIEGLL